MKQRNKRANSKIEVLNTPDAQATEVELKQGVSQGTLPVIETDDDAVAGV